MPMFKVTAKLTEPNPGLTAAEFDIEIQSSYPNGQEALAAIEKLLFIPGQYRIVVRGPNQIRVVYNIHRTAKRIALDQQSVSSTS